MSGRLFPHRATVRRDVAVGTNGRTVMTDLHTGVPCIFIPLPSRAELDNGYDVGTGADVYFKASDADVRTGDQLIWDGDTYNVRAARPIKIARVGHTHVLATREGK